MSDHEPLDEGGRSISKSWGCAFGFSLIFAYLGTPSLSCHYVHTSARADLRVGREGKGKSCCQRRWTMSNQVAHEMIDVPSMIDHHIGFRISVLGREIRRKVRHVLQRDRPKPELVAMLQVALRMASLAPDMLA